ncbi:hypothetical protein E2C01_074513 [Portunus trituberculatus]|uniref:Uncharacterized protein n=1 Tax=Portunus trituberculatus TaxID=210409 RepID=A0A5B7ICB6_PORTR|nr:hypothetical protein [Portunus trituberculatus]
MVLSRLFDAPLLANALNLTGAAPCTIRLLQDPRVGVKMVLACVEAARGGTEAVRGGLSSSILQPLFTLRIAPFTPPSPPSPPIPPAPPAAASPPSPSPPGRRLAR